MFDAHFTRRDSGGLILSRSWFAKLACVSLVAVFVLNTMSVLTHAASDSPVDTALVVSVDVSSSVDNTRYDLQLEGIAQALEDPAVQRAILNGPQGAILFSLVTWADRPKLDIPWRRIASADDANLAAQIVRQIPRNKGNFTCMARMFEFVNDKLLARIPVKALRSVVDVSGDGKDNCNPERSIPSWRDEIVRYGTTINGLPILEGREKDVLESWYKENVKGGLGAFILPANGFEDFGRAIRQKFIVEISGLETRPSTRRHAEAPSSEAAPSQLGFLQNR